MQNVMTRRELQQALDTKDRDDLVLVEDLTDGEQGYASQQTLDNTPDHRQVWVQVDLVGYTGCFMLRGNLKEVEPKD